MMSGRDMLSQEEIDALLRANNLDEEAISNHALSIDDYLSPMEQDALGEIGNICFGSSATALSTLLGQKTDITTPSVSVIEKGKLVEEFPEPHVAVHVEYTEGFKGINLLVIQTDDAKVIADLMMGGDGTNKDIELTELHISAVQEAMNQMMGSAATSMSTLFNKRVDISPPGIDLVDVSEGRGTNLPDEQVFIKISFRLKVGDLIDSNLMQLLPVSFAKDMVSLLLGGDMAAEAPMMEEPVPPPTAPSSPSSQQQPPIQPPFHGNNMQPGEQQGNVQVPPNYYQQSNPYQQPMYQQAPPGYQQPPMYPPPYQQPPVYPPPGFSYSQQAPSSQAQVQTAQFTPFHVPGGMPIADDRNLNLLLDIPLQVTVELGRTKKQIKEILELSSGSIIELDKLAGEPVDIFVNNKLIAKGEVVVIEENFGVRVTDIISQWDRVQKLQ